MRLRNVILRTQNQLAWQIRYNNSCKIYMKIESRPAVNLFLLHFYFRGNIVLYAVSCLLWSCLSYQMITKTRHNKLCVVTPWLFQRTDRYWLYCIHSGMKACFCLDSRSGVSNARPARAFCAVRDALGIFKYVANCFEKRCRERIKAEQYPVRFSSRP